MPTFVFTEDYQTEFLAQYHKVFDVYKKKFLVGEMVWNFADFMTDESKILVMILVDFKVDIELVRIVFKWKEGKSKS